MGLEYAEDITKPVKKSEHNHFFFMNSLFIRGYFVMKR